MDGDDVDANGNPEQPADKEYYYNNLRERIRNLEKRKKKLQDNTKWVKDRLDECEEGHTKTPKTTPSTTPEPTTTTTPKPTTTTTPKPKQKKYIIRTKKVSCALDITMYYTYYTILTMYYTPIDNSHGFIIKPLVMRIF